MTTPHDVPVGDAVLRVADDGPGGRPLVALHAGVADRRMWGAQHGAFPGWRTIAYDRRGFGETRHAAGPHDPVADLVGLLDALSIDRCVLMGCSRGGRVALDTVLAHPDRVAALVLVAASVSGAPEHDPRDDPPAVRALLEAYERIDAAGDLSALNEIEARVWLDGPLAPAGRVGGAVRELFLDMNGIALAAAPAGDEIPRAPAWDRLAAITVPTLVLTGTLDFPHLQARMHEVARRIAGARHEVLDAVAHLPGLEAPGPFNAAVGRFLSGLAAPAA